MKIGIDLDGVVIDSELTFRVYEEIFDIIHLKGNHLVDRTEPKMQHRYSWTKAQEDEFRNLYYRTVSKESGLLSGFLPVYKMLREMGHEFVVITARGAQVREMKNDAEKLIKKYDIKFDKYYWFVEDKLETCQKEKVDYMIDDDWHIIKKLADNKIKTIYFKDSGMKKLHENEYVKVVENWGDVLRFFVEFRRDK